MTASILMFPAAMPLPATASADGFAPGTRFRALNLSAAEGPRRAFPGAGGRFGAVALVGAAAKLEPPADIPDAVEVMPPRARVVRRPAFAGVAPDAPVRVEPMALAGMEAQGARFAPRHASLAAGPVKKQGLGLAIFLMVLVWAGVVGAGALFFSTPRSGMKIEWR